MTKTSKFLISFRPHLIVNFPLNFQACQEHPVDFNLNLRLYIDDEAINYVSFDNHANRREQRGSFAFYDFRDQTVPFEVARSMPNTSMRLVRGSEMINARQMDAENPSPLRLNEVGGFFASLPCHVFLLPSN